jgi:uncharacterized membrane protein YphA (DoxX/SURF4 family)
MDRLRRLVAWLNEHRDWCFDLMRIYLGLGLLVKGALFASSPDLLDSLLQGGSLRAAPIMLAHYVVAAHLCGGLMMALGLLTRFAALVQLPVLLGAVLFVHLEEGLFTRVQNLEFALLVLFLVFLVMLHGSGRWSMDHYLFASKRRTAPAR